MPQKIFSQIQQQRPLGPSTDLIEGARPHLETTELSSTVHTI